jgi:hypothetical protein
MLFFVVAAAVGIYRIPSIGFVFPYRWLERMELQKLGSRFNPGRLRHRKCSDHQAIIADAA